MIKLYCGTSASDNAIELIWLIGSGKVYLSKLIHVFLELPTTLTMRSDNLLLFLAFIIGRKCTIKGFIDVKNLTTRKKGLSTVPLEQFTPQTVKYLEAGLHGSANKV